MPRRLDSTAAARGRASVVTLESVLVMVLQQVALQQVLGTVELK